MSFTNLPRDPQATAEGYIEGVSVKRVRARATVGTDFVDIWTPATRRKWLIAAETLEISSDNGGDAAAGIGARTVNVIGLDANFEEIEETVTMNGVTPVATVASFIRVNDLQVTGSGSYANGDGVTTFTSSHLGTIQANAPTASALMAEIPVIDGNPMSRAHQSHYTVPAGKTLYLRNVDWNVFNTKEVTGAFMVRPRADIVSAPFIPAAGGFWFNGLTGNGNIPLDMPAKIDEKSDVWIIGETATGTSEVSFLLEFMQVDSVQ